MPVKYKGILNIIFDLYTRCQQLPFSISICYLIYRLLVIFTILDER